MGPAGQGLNWYGLFWVLPGFASQRVQSDWLRMVDEI